MDRTTALALTSKIEGHWSRGRSWSNTRTSAWTDTLEALDEGVAGTAIARLKIQFVDREPSPAEFMAIARRVNLVDGSTPRPSNCPQCEGAGTLPHAYTRHGHRYSGEKPCDCHEGRQVAERFHRWWPDRYGPQGQML